MHIHAFVRLPSTIPLPNVQPVGYIEELIEETMTLCSRGEPIPTSVNPSQPKILCSDYDTPEKISAIVRHQSRFSTH